MRIELCAFKSLEKCKEFINNFIKNKKIIDIKITPFQSRNNLTFLVYVGYSRE